MLGRNQPGLLSQIYTLRARTKVARRDYAAAIPLLERVLALYQTAGDGPQEVAARGQVYASLGNCFTALQQPDQAALAYGHSVELQPSLVAYRLSLARALRSAGRLDESVRAYEAGLAMPEVPSAIWGDYCNVLFQQQMSLPPKKRVWDVFGRNLIKAREALPEDVSLQVLTAEFEAEQGHVDAAPQVAARR